jgi:hypothetical protein
MKLTERELALQALRIAKRERLNTEPTFAAPVTPQPARNVTGNATGNATRPTRNVTPDPMTEVLMRTIATLRDQLAEARAAAQPECPVCKARREAAAARVRKARAKAKGDEA